MVSFIHDVLLDLKKRNVNFSQLTFVLPSKRAGVFLKHELSSVIDKTIFSPDIISIEEFVEDLSELKSISNTELLFELYSVYIKSTKKELVEPFDSFSKWAQILIQDFNEIDRYLIPQEKIFNYLSAIKDVEHWSLQKDQTDIVKNYLSLWRNLHLYYTEFSNNLKKGKIGYQGLIYREAVENIQSYIQSNESKQLAFVGFNALNTAEEEIIQELLQNDLASIYWDIDTHFIDNKIHDAGLFTRQHKSNWNYFNHNPFNWITNNYSTEKNIEVIGIPKNVGQAKYIGSLLDTLKAENSQLNNTAVVLGDETLLTPVINSLPETIDALNITMGLPLRSIPLASLFENLFQLHKNRTKESIYNKEILTILSHQFIRPLFIEGEMDFSNLIIDDIQKNNLIYISLDRLKNIAPNQSETIDLLFGNWEDNPTISIDNCLHLVLKIKAHLTENKKENLLSLEYLYRFNEVFNQLKTLINKYNCVTNIKTLFGLFKELLNSESLDFKGEPLQGLQLMGMLESRVLDFETVIISSVNEGILPSGKSNNSFIPFDVKIENNLPTYKEKDAVYTYHFFRLLQRAKNVYILYNTEPDAFNGGEKSRFITQLEIEGVHNIKHKLVTPNVPTSTTNLNEISKSDLVMNRIKEVAERGFSPSSLTSYIRNPLDFYYQKILKVKEYEDVEETVASNTLGTVVHNTLEDFYKPLIGQFLSVDVLKDLKKKIEKTVTHHFKDIYKEGDLKSGKNLIIFEIAKRYVLNFINLEIEDVKQGNKIKILEIESNDNKVKLDIPELNFPVYLTGKVDRIDEYNGVTRIIDYKTGKVEEGKVTIVNWEDLNTDYDKYSKPYQILAYAYMMNAKKPFTNPVEAGIISFKNLSNGFLKFAVKESTHSRTKDELITQETLDNYFDELKKLILEICNPEIDFIEKEV